PCYALHGWQAVPMLTKTPAVIALSSMLLLISSRLPLGAQTNEMPDPAATLPRMPPESLPDFGTFWQLSIGAPNPWNPWSADTNVAVYLLGSNTPYGSFPDGSFLIDDRGQSPP